MTTLQKRLERSLINKIYQGHILDALKEIPDEYFDLISDRFIKLQCYIQIVVEKHANVKDAVANIKEITRDVVSESKLHHYGIMIRR